MLSKARFCLLLSALLRLILGEVIMGNPPTGIPSPGVLNDADADMVGH